MKPQINEWIGPPAMETGAPMPWALQKVDRVWVAYVCQNPEFPGWDKGAPINHPGFEIYSAVLEFNGVTWASLGWPNDEVLHKHPLYQHGLGFYGFYEALGTPELEGTLGLRHWIVTFHDETLEVIAREAKVLANRVEGEVTSEIAKAHAEKDAGSLNEDDIRNYKRRC